MESLLFYLNRVKKLRLQKLTFFFLRSKYRRRDTLLFLFRFSLEDFFQVTFHSPSISTHNPPSPSPTASRPLKMSPSYVSLRKFNTLYNRTSLGPVVQNIKYRDNSRLVCVCKKKTKLFVKNLVKIRVT